jgi:phage gp37-like protein
MSLLSTTEDAMIALIKGLIGQNLREVSTLDGTWTLGELQRSLQVAPCVRVAFLGGKATEVENASINADFGVYAISKMPTQKQQRRGTPQEIGAYDMIEGIVPSLNEKVIAGVGTLFLKRIDAVFTEQTFQMGGSVFAAIFELRNLVIAEAFDPTAFQDFLTFDAQSDVAPADGDIDLESEETLPQ